MIRRLLHAELSDVRARAKAALTEIVDRYTFWDRGEDFGVFFIADRYGDETSPGVGVGYCLDNPERSAWPDGARLLTIGRVTLAAWGGRPS